MIFIFQIVVQQLNIVNSKNFLIIMILYGSIWISMYSSEHLLYLKRQKRKTLFVRFMQVAIIATLIIIWQLLADFHLINTFITSSPK